MSTSDAPHDKATIEGRSLIALLAESGLANASEAGNFIDPQEEYVLCGDARQAEIAQVYLARAEHLARLAQSSPHAAQLSASSRELAANARRGAQRCRFVIFPGERPYWFDVFLDSASGRALGCHKTVSREHVSDEEWRELWGDAN